MSIKKTSKPGTPAKYNVNGKNDVPRQTVVKQINEGKHPGYNTPKIGGKEYPRSNPDGSTNNNVNRK